MASVRDVDIPILFEDEAIELPTRTSQKPLIAVNYWGGKAKHLKFISRLLKENTFLYETHCGSIVVSLNNDRFQHITVNDIDGLVYDFLNTLKSEPPRTQFIEQVYFSGCSKREFDTALLKLATVPTNTQLENAVAFFILCNQSYGGAMKGWQRTPNQVRNAMPQSVSKWLGKFPDLMYVVERLLSIQIDNMDGTELIRKYGKKNTTLYCDPTYHRMCRVAKNVYRYEMSDEDHIRFLEAVTKSPADIAISGYDNEVYEEYLRDWFVSRDRVKKLSGYSSDRQEVLWTNYHVEEVQDA